MPPHLPNYVRVVCNNRRAIMIVRNQRVLFDGAEVSASRFEQLAGKGDAKKWKNSIW